MAWLSFVHAADLHLDAPFQGFFGLPEEHDFVFETLREATFRAWGNLVDLCLERRVDFLLVAGDLYNGADRSLRAQLAFRDGVRRLAEAGIRVYVAHGNHDPLDSWVHSVRLPDTVHVFGPREESVVFEKEGDPVARIHGASYPRRSVGAGFGTGFRREGGEPFQIGVLHCTVGPAGGHEVYAPRTLEELRASGLDYWALGHVHTRSVLSPSDPFVGYPGNLQGRHANESGPRGAWVVRVDGEGPLAEPEFVALDAVRWDRRTASIDGVESVSDLLERLERLVDEAGEAAGGRPVVLRVELGGRGALHRELARPGALEALLEQAREAGAARDPFVWVERIEPATRPAADMERRRQGDDFLGECLRVIQGFREVGPAGWEPLRACLAELYGAASVRRVLDEPDEGELAKLLEEVEALCLDRLADEGD
ncbi:metallophosphoesterase family protein [Deferrisoma sp.]